ncbi:TonB family protein [Phocaeicola massiliensis]|jgi:TonB family protein|uniref:TonB family protein n=1 Tax=Phocaeicola massiliensis TaxID=204516 RepID=UPI000E3F1675|nr:TonB family protein [Phocaeicola massiliensis]RGF11473.1 TonB family protein [Bacteroides sp. AM16-15]
MKILKTILAALVLAITASSCHKDGEQADATSPLKDSPVVAQQVITLNGDTIIVCDLSLLKDTIDLPLSTFVSDFELVDLGEDEEALIKETSGGGSIAVSPNYIGIYSGTGYKLFDKTGKYITSLSARGQGPNEYAFSIYDSYIDEKNDRAYLLPMNGNKILVYDLKGNAQPYIPLAHETTKGKFYVDEQKKLLYVANMPFSDTASTFWMQDFEGKLIKEIIAGHLTIVPPDFSNDINVSMNTEEIDYSVFHWKNTVDTLYHYNEADNRLAPSFTVNFKDNPILHDYIELPDYYLIRLIEIESDYRYIYGLIDKKTLKGNYIKLKLDMLGNIDAPAWAIFERGLYTANIYAYYLQGQCDRLSDLSSLPSGIAKYIQDLQQNDCEDLNNIILIGRLKKNTAESFMMNDKDYQEQPQMNKTVDTIKKEKEEVSLKRTGKKEETITEEDDSNRIYTGFGVFSHIPLLKGGLDYFRKNNRYNDWDSKNPKETLIEYVVEKNGKASHVSIKESSGNAELDQEAIRLIKEAEYTVAKLKNGKEARAGGMMINVTFPTK